ncbi:MAG: bacillithiol biosynthesis protein BshC [Planctomycetota bacterium]
MPVRDTPSIRVRDLPLSWFDRRHYRPRARGAAGDSWFLLSPAFRPPESVPPDPPAEPIGGRAALRAAFEETCRRWGLPLEAAARRSLQVLGEEGTAAIVTGQQPGFLGGPLMSLYKALTAVAAARAYRALTGRPCAPVFWVAAEDHDLEEVRVAHVPGPGPEGVSFRYPLEPDRRPLSDYPMDAGALAVLERAEEHLARRRHGEEARELLELYRSRDFAGGFAAILAALLGRAGLLVLDPACVRRQAADLFRAVVEHPAEVLACVERGRRDVRERGIEPLVAGRLPLFALLDGKRHHLAVGPFGLEVDGAGERLSRERLLGLLAADPPALSAGALLRPLIQQAVLPCALAIGGPAEVGYFAQLGPLADFLGVARPRAALRLTATLVDGKPARLAASLSLERIASAQAPEDLLEPEAGAPGLAELQGLAPRVEEALLGAARGVEDGEDAAKLRARAAEIRAALERFAELADRAHRRRRTAELALARKLWDAVFPAGELQERRWSTIHFVAKHGTAWIDDLLGAIEPDPLRLAHRWVLFEEPSAAPEK